MNPWTWTASSTSSARRSSSAHASGGGAWRRCRSASRRSTAAAGPTASSRGSPATRDATGAGSHRRSWTRSSREKLAGRFSRARARTILLDYDGTLRELEPHPDLALPTPEIRSLLRTLAALPSTEVHIVSGRRRRNLEQWFGQLRSTSVREHGYLARAPGESWHTLVDLDLSWMPQIERLLRRVAADVPGAFVERKSAAIAWHYREAEPE